MKRGQKILIVTAQHKLLDSSKTDEWEFCGLLVNKISSKGGVPLNVLEFGHYKEDKNKIPRLYFTGITLVKIIMPESEDYGVGLFWTKTDTITDNWVQYGKICLLSDKIAKKALRIFYELLKDREVL